MLDKTQIRIIDATMRLIIEKGYSKTTTKNIAAIAGVNESTIFRRFREKKEIVLTALRLPQWNPGLSEDDFVYHGILKDDLLSFSKAYMKKVTPKMVRVSIGLRSAKLENVALPEIVKIPLLLKKVLIKYFTEMQQQGKIRECNIESAALQFISMNFGFVILDVSFGKSLMGITKEEYIKNSIELFASGISS